MSTQTERVQEETVDWREALSDTYDQITAEQPEVVEEVVEPVEAAEEIEVDAADTEEVFEESAGEETEEVIEAVADDATEAEAESTLTTDQITALQYMPKEMREAVEKLDETLQNEVINHHMESEKAYRKKTMGFNDDVKLAQEVRDILTPVKGALNGVPEQQYLSQLVQYDQALRANPGAAIEQLAQMYGYDLATHGQEQGFKDPLQVEVEQLKANQQRQAQHAQQMQLQQAQKQIDDFASDKPDFQAIEPLITAKVQQGLDLQSAYDAVKGELNMSAPVATQTSTQRVPIKQKKKAASGVKSTNSTVQRSEPMTTKDELAQNWDKFFGSK